MLSEIRCITATRILAAVVLLMTAHSTAAAWPVVSSSPLDLAAMAALPLDLPEPTFFATGGAEFTLRQYAEQLAARGSNPAVGSVERALVESGWRRAFEGRFSTGRSASSSSAVRLTVTVVEFADEHGADAGLTLLIDHEHAREGEPFTPSTSIGEESAITFRSAAVDSAPRPEVGLWFRTGRIVGGVGVAGAPLNASFPFVRIEELGGLLQARIEADRSRLPIAPRPLSTLALRLEEPSGTDFPLQLEHYVFLDGAALPNSGQTTEDRQGLAEVYREWHVLATYDMQVYIPADDPGDREYLDDTFVRILLYRLEDDVAAEQWVQEAPGSAAPDTRPLTSITPLGDSASGYALTDVRGTVDRVSAPGYALYVRVGSDVAFVQVTRPGGLDLADVESVAAMQIECLVAGSCPTTNPVPAPFLAAPAF